MNNSRRRPQKHWEVESGSDLRITSKPPVNATIRNVTLSGNWKREFDGEYYDEDKIGYNILPYPFYQTTQTIHGITYTDNGNGTITANGTATEDSTFKLRNEIPPLVLQNGGTYTLAGCPSGGSPSTYFLAVLNTSYVQLARDTGNAITFTTNYTDYYCFIRVSSGVTVSNLIFKPMFVLGSTVPTEWIPYFNLSPNSPLSIVTSGNVANDKIVGKNLFNKDDISLQIQPLYILSSGTALASSANVLTVKYSCKTNTTYTIQKSLGNRFRVCTVDEEPVSGTVVYHYSQKYGLIGLQTITITTDSNSRYIIVMLEDGADLNNLYINILSTVQIEFGFVATAYDKYRGTYTSINIKDTSAATHELTALPSGICDTINSEKIIKRIQKYVLNGENWIYSESIHGYYKVVAGLPNTLNCLCNYGVDYNHRESDISPIIRPVEGILRLYNFIDYFATVADLQTALNATNLVLYVPLATPLEYDTDGTEAAKLQNLQSTQWETNISFNNTVPFTFSGEIKKLGIRARITAKIIDENGNYLVDENGNNICGLY